MNNIPLIVLGVAMAGILLLGLSVDFGVGPGPVTVTAKSGLEIHDVTWRAIADQDLIRISGKVVNGSSQDADADLRITAYGKVSAYPPGLIFFLERCLPLHISRTALDLFITEATALGGGTYSTGCLYAGSSQAFEYDVVVVPKHVGEVTLVATPRRAACLAFPEEPSEEPCEVETVGEVTAVPCEPSAATEAEQVVVPEPTAPSSQPEEEGATTSQTAEIENLPAFQLQGTRDVSFAQCVRIVADVVLDEVVSLSDDQAVEIARRTVEAIIASRHVNAVGVFIWLPGSEVGKEDAAVSIDWAPDGQWDQADSVSTGDYTQHAYRVVFNNT
jgi:hypothetical protein